MDGDKSNIKEITGTTEIVSKVEKDTFHKCSPLLDECSEASECSAPTPQLDTNTKRVTKHLGNNGLSATLDELPVKRVRLDKSVEDESSPTKNVKETSAKHIVGKHSLPAAIKSKSTHKVKWVEWKGSYVPIITQNENGPCPLIAIVNILLLREKVSLINGTTEIFEEDLEDQVKKALESTVPKDPNPNHLQNMLDAIAVLPQLKTGLDVNVKFTGVKNFEYTPECLIFDLLDIHLYHGWLLDPQSAEVVSAVGNSSYNQLVEMIVNKKTSKDPIELNQAEVAEQFLESTATQLTCHGLCELNAAMGNGDMAVLFRNNHFSVIYKHKEVLCQLVTDQGFLDEKRVVWETLTSIFGDETFLDGNFRSMLPKTADTTSSSLLVIDEQQISEDFLVALSLQDEPNKQHYKEFGWDAYGNALGAIGMQSDEELARRLHIEEERMAQVSVSSARTSLNIPPDGSENSGRHAIPVSSQQSGPSAPKENEETLKSESSRCTIC